MQVTRYYGGIHITPIIGAAHGHLYVSGIDLNILIALNRIHVQRTSGKAYAQVCYCRNFYGCMKVVRGVFHSKIARLAVNRELYGHAFAAGLIPPDVDSIVRAWADVIAA